VGAAPFGVAVFEPAGLATAAAQKAHRVVGVDAVRTAAVGDDLDPVGKATELAGQCFDGDRPGPGDVPRRILGRGPDIDDDDVTGGDPASEFAAGDLFEPISVAKVRGGQLVELFEMGRGHVSQRGPQLADPLRREPVVDPGPLATGDHEPGRREHPEMK
jgi:hypothetical protein